MDIIQALLPLLKGAGGCGCCSGESSPGSVLNVKSRYSGRVHGSSGLHRAATSTIDRQLTINFGQQAMSEQAVELAARDAHLLAERIAKNPDAVLRLVLDFRRGDLDGAIRVAREIELTEESLHKDGGGFWGLVVLLAIVIVLASAERTSDLADPPPPPKGPIDVSDAQVKDVMGLVGKSK